MPDHRQADARETRERTFRAGGEVGWALRAVLRAKEQVTHALAHRLGLSAMDTAAMERLLEGGDLGPADLGRTLGITSASATVLIDRLELAGHVHRVRDEHDRRRVRLEVTEQADRECIGALSPLLADLDAIEAALGANERELVARYLREVAEAMRRYTEATRAADPPAPRVPSP
jgi:DNA-binding MarR family transcriptional regulator